MIRTKFNKIILSDTLSFEFNNNEDVIGYDWKERTPSDNSYSIISNKYHIIKDTEGYYYKQKLINFYNSVGIKGNPKFEVAKLWYIYIFVKDD